MAPKGANLVVVHAVIEALRIVSRFHRIRDIANDLAIRLQDEAAIFDIDDIGRAWVHSRLYVDRSETIYSLIDEESFRHLA